MAAFMRQNFEYKGRVGWIHWPLCNGDFDWAMRYIQEQIDTSWEAGRAYKSVGWIPYAGIKWEWEWKKGLDHDDSR